MVDDLFSVADRVTLVSGGSRGIGRELASAFADCGAQVIITGRDAATLEQAAHEISAADRPVRAIVCDVSSPDAIREAVARVLDEFGHIDVLLNVAGVNKRQPAETFSPEEFDFILDINLRGAFFMAQEVGKHMIGRRSGVQVHIDSLNTYAPLKGVLPYAISKAGISMMTRGLASEWGRYGVRVNALAPGFILTDLTRKLWSDPTMHEWGCTNTPLGRLGEVDDLIGAAIFLASDASKFMTGQVVYVDGGFSAGIAWPIQFT
ncbi:MAG TPA: glucose 1-dehydrogenase [Planctomycetaceae bacterium]|nr:glucose 1-dehydrogenase [Planctomycetaceae bacterium]